MISLILAALFTLVENGEPKATLVVAEGDRPARFAAGQLRYWTKEISGAELAYCTVAASATGGVTAEGSDSARRRGADGTMPPRVFLGRGFAEKKFPDDVKWLGNGQGFAVREADGDLYVFGGVGVGTLFGCYDLLEKNTDVIWPCPDSACDRIFTPQKTIAVKAGYREKPTIPERQTMHDRDARSMYFVLRQRAYSNWEYHQFKTFGIRNNDYECHNTWIYFRNDETRKAHPEWYGVYRGKKMWNPGGFDGNLCFSCLDSAEYYAERFLAERLPSSVSEGPYGIGAEDNNLMCECERCLAPLKLPDGRVLKLEDDPELFRSTQFFLWINRIAEIVKAKRPDVKLETIAYMYGQRPPAIRFCDNVTVQYAPIGKNMKKTYFGKGNEKQKDWLVEWANRCNELSFFEYWGDGQAFPRPISSVLAVDIPFMASNKTFNVNTEWGLEGAKSKAQYVSALEHWVTMKLMWDASRPLEELREEFFRKAFREGADEMRVFYDTVRDAWFKDASTSFYYDDAVRLTGYYFLGDEALGAKCFGALTNAYAAVKHPTAKVLIGKIKESMEGYLAAARKTFVKGGSAVIPFVDDPTLVAIEGVGWSKAFFLDEKNHLKMMLKMKPKENLPVEAAMAHDGKNLYVRFKTAWRPQAFREGPKGVCHNEHWELFIQADKTNPEIPYYMFAVDPQGRQETYVGYNPAEKPPKWTVEVKSDGDNWTALCTFPFSEIGIKGGVAPRIHVMHHGQQTPDQCEWKSWNGYGVHDTAAFTDCRLDKGEK